MKKTHAILVSSALMGFSSASIADGFSDNPKLLSDNEMEVIVAGSPPDWSCAGGTSSCSIYMASLWYVPGEADVTPLNSGNVVSAAPSSPRGNGNADNARFND